MKEDLLDLSALEGANPPPCVLYVDQTVSEAVSSIRGKELSGNVLYLYVLDQREKLIGTVAIRELITRGPDVRIAEIINTKVKFLHGHQTMQDALLLMKKYHLLALPVLDHGRFIGVINIQDFFDEEVQFNSMKKRMEIFQTLGFSLEKDAKQTTLQKYKTRVPWIFCNMLGGLGCAVISDFYSDVLLKAIVLAMFIPLVLSLSESISMQAMTQSIYAIGKKFNFWKQVGMYIYVEIRLFLLVSLTCGTIVGGLSLFWREGFLPVLIIATGIFISIIVSALFGGIVPLILHSWRLDPKVASGPIVLMFSDVLTTLIYLSIAFWWIM